ncbi:MAG: MerR family transcriptional regulator [Candidatus Omnitrophota bacterium]
MVLCDKDDKVIKVYPYGSEEQLRYEMVLEILFEADRRALEKLIEGRKHKEQVIDSQIEECDKKVFYKCTKRSAKRYNMTQTARILGVHRETLYYWIKKGWIKPKRDYRNYPVFTVLDIEELIKWKNTIKC